MTLNTCVSIYMSDKALEVELLGQSLILKSLCVVELTIFFHFNNSTVKV